MLCHVVNIMCNAGVAKTVSIALKYRHVYILIMLRQPSAQVRLSQKETRIRMRAREQGWIESIVQKFLPV